MRHLIRAVVVVVCALGVSETAMAQFARRGGGGVSLQSRSYSGNVSRNLNTTQNLNRNVNVNQNVNVNRNVNVNTNVSGYHGGCYNCVYHDNGWNWGSFAAGAATTAVVAGAARTAAPVAVVAPPVGTVVGVLPTGCVAVAGAAAAIYSCGSAYYRPYYQGTTLVYQVVTNP
jgi:hypothetical protein